MAVASRFSPLVFAASLWFTGCCCCGGWGPPPPVTPPQNTAAYNETQQETRNGSATLSSSVKGSEFNKFFPPQAGEHDIVFKQEKQGFAQISLQKGGNELATMSISDTANEPDAREKFKESIETIAGNPAAAQGDKGTAVLVADRFQVSVRSVDPAFTADDRKAWLEKFDLAGLAQLK